MVIYRYVRQWQAFKVDDWSLYLAANFDRFGVHTCFCTIVFLLPFRTILFLLPAQYLSNEVRINRDLYFRLFIYPAPKCPTFRQMVKCYAAPEITSFGYINPTGCSFIYFYYKLKSYYYYLLINIYSYPSYVQDGFFKHRTFL